MLEDNTVAATKHIVTTTSYSRHYGNGKGKRGWDDHNRRRTRDSRDSRRNSHDNEVVGLRDLFLENPRRDNSAELTRFTLPPSQLFPIIQSLQGFEWIRPHRGDPEMRDKFNFVSITRTSSIEPTTVTNSEAVELLSQEETSSRIH